LKKYILEKTVLEKILDELQELNKKMAPIELFAVLQLNLYQARTEGSRSVYASPQHHQSSPGATCQQPEE